MIPSIMQLHPDEQVYDYLLYHIAINMSFYCVSSKYNTATKLLKNCIILRGRQNHEYLIHNNEAYFSQINEFGVNPDSSRAKLHCSMIQNGMERFRFRFAIVVVVQDI